VRPTPEIPAELAERVLAAINDAVVVLDRDARVVCWAGSADRLLGLPAREALGQRITLLSPELSRLDPDEVATLGGAERLDTVRHTGPNGPALAVTATAMRDEAGAAVGMTALIRSMGGWLDPVERAGRSRRQWHRTLGSIVQELVEQAGEDPSAMDASEELARMLVGQARRLLPTAQCLLAVVPREHQDRLQIVAGAGTWAERQVGREWPVQGTLAGQALARGRPVETTRALEQGGLPDTAVEGGILSGRLIPLLSANPLPDGRQALGVLGFYRDTRSYFTPYERRLFEEFARLVTLSLHRAELLRSAGEAHSRLQTGVDVAVQLAVSLERDQVLNRLVHTAADAVDAERVALLLIEGPDARVVEAFDRHGSFAAVPKGERFPVASLISGDEPVVLRAMHDHRPRFMGSYQVPGLQTVTDWGQDGPRHTLTLPLVLAGEVIAVLLVSRLRDQPFGREDGLTLQMVGNVAALALNNAQLFTDAQDASRARSDFLNMAGHELRTPLTVIKGYLSMMGDGSLGEVPPGLRQPVDLLSTKAEELGILIDDLLFTSKLESGRLPAHPMRLDLGIAVREAAKRAEPRVTLLGGKLDVDIADESLVVSADLEHVSRVLDNLVNNALTYRRPGQPAWVRLWARVEDDMAAVSVEDNGRGIPPEMHGRIFERFVRGERAGAGSSGSGLGLYISSQLAARHGGRLELDQSVPGQGSRFSVRLPRATPR
jgi:signal transduction histidine kinase